MRAHAWPLNCGSPSLRESKKAGLWRWKRHDNGASGRGTKEGLGLWGAVIRDSGDCPLSGEDVGVEDDIYYEIHYKKTSVIMLR